MCYDPACRIRHLQPSLTVSRAAFAGASSPRGPRCSTCPRAPPRAPSHLKHGLLPTATRSQRPALPHAPSPPLPQPLAAHQRGAARVRVRVRQRGQMKARCRTSKCSAMAGRAHAPLGRRCHGAQTRVWSSGRRPSSLRLRSGALHQHVRPTVPRRKGGTGTRTELGGGLARLRRCAQTTRGAGAARERVLEARRSSNPSARCRKSSSRWSCQAGERQRVRSPLSGDGQMSAISCSGPTGRSERDAGGRQQHGPAAEASRHGVYGRLSPTRPRLTLLRAWGLCVRRTIVQLGWARNRVSPDLCRSRLRAPTMLKASSCRSHPGPLSCGADELSARSGVCARRAGLEQLA